MSESRAGVRRILVHIDKIELLPMRLVYVTVSYPGTFEEDVVLCLEPDEINSLVGDGVPWIRMVLANSHGTAIDIIGTPGNGSRYVLTAGDSLSITVDY
jgi:hypothetical protein